MLNGSLSEYFNGYILVKVESLSPEKIINDCAKEGIVLYDITRKNYTTIILKMRYKQYKKFKKITRNSSSKTKILKKHGIHFTYKNLTRRKFFLIGGLIFLCLIIFLSNFIWTIDIKGNKRVDSKIIYQSLKKSGLRVGILKYSINLRKIEENVIRDMNEVSVITINFSGTKANVNIVERTMPAKIVNKEIPSNIVAVKEGIITNILSYKGVPLVKIGDLVKPNQILISGRLSEIENELNKTTHAMGIVKAKTWYEAAQSVDYNYKYEIRTGIFKVKMYYLVGGKRVYIKNSNITFEKYDKIENKNPLALFGINIPIEKITEYYYEKKDLIKHLNYNEAVNLGISEATKLVKNKVPGNAKILEVKSFKENNKKGVRIRILYIIEENIGLEREIK